MGRSLTAAVRGTTERRERSGVSGRRGPRLHRWCGPRCALGAVRAHRPGARAECRPRGMGRPVAGEGRATRRCLQGSCRCGPGAGGGTVCSCSRSRPVLPQPVGLGPFPADGAVSTGWRPARWGVGSLLRGRLGIPRVAWRGVVVSSSPQRRSRARTAFLAAVAVFAVVLACTPAWGAAASFAPQAVYSLGGYPRRLR
jgi:hypothetical protein